MALVHMRAEAGRKYWREEEILEMDKTVLTAVTTLELAV